MQWLWESFHVHGEPLSVEQQATKCAQLLAAVDSDHNGRITYDEFEKLFLKAVRARVAWRPTFL